MTTDAQHHEQMLDDYVAGTGVGRKTPRKYQEALRLVDGTLTACRHMLLQHDIEVSGSALVELTKLVMQTADAIESDESDESDTDDEF
jgi:hypothetical protein